MKPRSRGQAPVATDLHGGSKMNFGQAFGVSTGRATYTNTVANPSSEYALNYPRASYDEDIRLAPYTYAETSTDANVLGDKSDPETPSPTYDTYSSGPYVRMPTHYSGLLDEHPRTIIIPCVLVEFPFKCLLLSSQTKSHSSYPARVSTPCS